MMHDFLQVGTTGLCLILVFLLAYFLQRDTQIGLAYDYNRTKLPFMSRIGIVHRIMANGGEIGDTCCCEFDIEKALKVGTHNTTFRYNNTHSHTHTLTHPSIYTVYYY